MSDLITESAQQTDAGATGGTQTGTGTPPAQQSGAFTQDDLNRILADEKKKWKQAQEAATKEAARQAAEAEAEKKGEFERLASERGQKLAQIEAEQATITERVSAYEGVLTAQIKARIKQLPEAARSKLPDGDPLSQLAWLDAVEAAVQAATPVARAPLRTPPGGSGASMTQSASDLIERKRNSGEYAL